MSAGAITSEPRQGGTMGRVGKKAVAIDNRTRRKAVARDATGRTTRPRRYAMQVQVDGTKDGEDEEEE